MHRILVLAATIAIVGGAASPAFSALAQGDCVDFESLTPTTTYTVPSSFADSGVTISVGQFQWSNGIWTSDGNAQVDTGNTAGGLGNDMGINNVNLDFDFGRSVKDLRMLYANLGGNINLSINGDFRNESDLSVLDGQWVGGTLVQVLSSPTGRGVLRVTGIVTSFALGGQELWLDDVCDSLPTSACIEFEDLPLPKTYNFGQFFVDSGAIIGLQEFFWLPTGSTTSGSCAVDNSQISGGTGQDVNSNNSNLDFDFGDDLLRVDLLYANSGGNINLRVNGVPANVAHLSDLDGATLGGAMISVIPPGADDGQLIVEGAFSDFAIGGQELWIDHVCWVGQSIFSDDFEVGNTSAWSAAVP